MLAVQGLRHVVIGDKFHQLANVLEQKIKHMRTACCPGDVRLLLCDEALAGCCAVCDNLDHILWPNAINDLDELICDVPGILLMA